MTENFRPPRYPKRLMLITVTAFFAIFLTNIYLRSVTRRSFEAASEKIDRLIALKEEIKQQQQEQELAIRMGAFSGKLSWENSHFRTKKSMYDIMRSIREILPELPELEKDPNEQSLQALDRNIFNLIRHGRKQQAIELAQGLNREYLLTRQSKFIDQVEKSISTFAERQTHLVARQSRTSDKLNWAMIIISTALTIGMIWIFNDWAKKIQEINAGLDSLVKEKIEELDRERMKMIESSKMATLGEMAGGIAHEINNPLTIIKLAASQIDAQVKSDTYDRNVILDHSAILLKTIDRIAKIVHGLRMFSRDGSRDPFQRLCVGKLVDEALSFCGERLKAQGIEIRQKRTGEDLQLDCRETQISQVLLNLLNNAADAVSGLPEKWVEIETRENGDWVELVVTDSGLGIPEDIRHKLFQPFFSTKEIGKGTGIGLSISLGIVKTHRGDILIDALSPHTSFIVRLPKKQTAAA